MSVEGCEETSPWNFPLEIRLQRTFGWSFVGVRDHYPLHSRERVVLPLGSTVGVPSGDFHERALYAWERCRAVKNFVYNGLLGWSFVGQPVGAL